MVFQQQNLRRRILRCGWPLLLASLATGCSVRRSAVIPSEPTGGRVVPVDLVESVSASEPRGRAETSMASLSTQLPTSSPATSYPVAQAAAQAATPSNSDSPPSSTPTVAGAAEIQADNGQPTLSLSDILSLADSENPNVQVARERIDEAYARVRRAEVLWIPSLRAGANYNHHEGTIQDVAGNVFQTTRSSAYGGLGAQAVGAGSPAVPGLIAQFHLSDALFQPRIAAHQAASRQFGAEAVRNQTLRDAAGAYLELVRAEHGLAITQEALDKTRHLHELTRQFAASGQGLPADHQRMEAELAVREQEQLAQEEAVQVASARLAEVLHADPAVPIASGEPSVVPLDLITADEPVAAMVALGLSRRPELCEQRHLVCEAVERLRREKYAPLVPSVLLGLSYGSLGGGLGSTIGNTGDRWDADAVAFWELRNLGLGDRAAQAELASATRQAHWREVAVLDRIAREVVEAHAQVEQRRRRIELAQSGIVAAEKSYQLNRERIENAQGLPIEMLQAIQALTTARRAYLNAAVDYNLAQFQLGYATGWFLDE